LPSGSATGQAIDIAVVGGGIAGVYCAWRLRRERPGTNVQLFERDKRIGGRLLSVEPPHIPNTRVELGGMRFTEQHKGVHRLLQQLRIDSAPFPVTEDQNIVYVRGCVLRQQDLKDPAVQLPYTIAPDERIVLAEEGWPGLVARAAQRALHSILKKHVDLARVKWPEVIDQYQYDGYSLWDLPLRYFVQRYISDEALRLVDDVSGYNSLLTVWNAADGLPWNLAEFGQIPRFRYVTDGFDTLPQKLHIAFERLGGGVHTGRALTRLVWNAAKQVVELKFHRDTRPVLANKVILAMPRRSLERLDRTGNVMGDTKVQELIGSVTPIPLFKLAMCYPFAWWETIEPVQVMQNGRPVKERITRGQSVTDLPVRQCYYWAKDGRGEKAVVLVYDDGRDREYWRGLLKKRGAADEFGKLHKLATERAERQWNENAAPRHLVEEAHRQLLEMHKVRHRLDIPKPYAAACRDWGEDPYGGGVNFWRVGVDSRQVAKKILQPKKDQDVPVFICGESYSHDQGWVEGALKTADDVLALKPFDLPKP
jgi:monoamine oxidase